MNVIKIENYEDTGVVKATVELKSKLIALVQVQLVEEEFRVDLGCEVHIDCEVDLNDEDIAEKEEFSEADVIKAVETFASEFLAANFKDEDIDLDPYLSELSFVVRTDLRDDSAVLLIENTDFINSDTNSFQSQYAVTDIRFYSAESVANFVNEYYADTEVDYEKLEELKSDLGFEV